ncbi:MAG: tripartite tricarboxylate transporter TctB family protein [Chloroflexi bacterium]|nr:tripartite tricarboxylate transporter TctB family protein [Chloroflexota bacterium]
MRTAWQRGEALFCLLVVATVGAALWASLGWGQRAGLFPWIALGVTLPLALWQLVDDLRGKTLPPAAPQLPQGDSPSEAAEAAAQATRRGASVVGWVLGYLGAVWLLGFAIGGGIATVFYLRLGFGERWRTTLIYGLATYLALEVVFRQVLLIPFPVGTVFEWLDLDPRLNLGIHF